MVAQQPSCVVLGGGGFIGTNFCRRLAVSGYRVRAFGRRCLFLDALHGVEWYQGDFTDTGSVASAIESFRRRLSLDPCNDAASGKFGYGD
jgi:uncharacterized protein YbjT (DUF2867 family)